MSERNKHGNEERVEDIPVARIAFEVPGVAPEHFEEKLDVDHGMGAKIATELVGAENFKHGDAARINWGHVIKNIESGKHRGFFVVTSGAIILTIGIGIKKHGRDIVELLSLVTKHKESQGKGMKK